jgi:hypothetical protein
VTVCESPGALPAAPLNVTLPVAGLLPFAGLVSVTSGAAVSVPMAAS